VKRRYRECGIILLLVTGCGPCTKVEERLLEPPPPPLVYPLPSLTNQPQLLVTGRKSPDTAILLNGSVVVPLDAATNWSMTTTLTEGFNWMQFNAEDTQGVESGAVVVWVTLDTVPPSAPTIDALPDVVSTTTIIVTGGKEAGSAVWGPQGLAWGHDGSLTWAGLMPLIQEGVNGLTFTATDLAGNVSLTSTAQIIRDTTPPWVRLVLPENGKWVRLLQPSFKWVMEQDVVSSAIEVATAQDFTPPSIVMSATGLTGTTWSSSTPLPLGRLYWRVSATDRVGWEGTSLVRRVELGKAAGDLNGDGWPDFCIGEPGNGPGMVYCYWGGPSLTNTASVVLTGENNGDAFGYSLAWLPDVNGDGYGDLIVGAPNWPGFPCLKGKAYLFLGGPTFTSGTVAAFVTSGTVCTDRLGYVVAAAGDLDGDEREDIAIGVPWAGAEGSNRGEIHIYSGATILSGGSPLVLQGIRDMGYFGDPVRGDIDVDGDGLDDLLVGSYPGSPPNGEVWILRGGLPFSTVPAIIFSGQNEGTFGFSVGRVDLTADGYGDILVGASRADGGGVDRGAVYVYGGGGDALHQSYSHPLWVLG